MSIRGGRGPREDYAQPVVERDRGRPNGYRRTGRYGRGPGDQRRYERYGDRNGGVGGLLRFGVFLVVLAALVLVALLTIARPIARIAIVPLAENNTALLHVGFIEDLVREDIGPALTKAPGTDDRTVEVTIEDGDTPETLAPKLLEAGLITSQRAFLFEARLYGLADKIAPGAYGLNQAMTAKQAVNALVFNRIVVQTTAITFREGLRIEQMAAKLQVTEGTQIDPQQFYDLAMDPPDSLLADFPWILDEGVHRKGTSLEGFLYPATYEVRIDAEAPTTAEGLIRMMLKAFYERVGQERLDGTTKGGLTFQQALVLGSIVEREAQLDEERPLIAGVYQNRLNPKLWPLGKLQSDPTIFYVHDTLKLRDTKFAQWSKYVFWAALPKGYQLPQELGDLEPYNTYTDKGLPPLPICSPSIASIDAALNPNTKTGYLFFIAKGDGSKTSAFAKTHAEHDRNVAKYKKN